jgi:hypothetical protein
MKVRVLEKTKGLLRLGCSGVALMLFASAAHAQSPGWLAEIINVAGDAAFIDNQTEALSLFTASPNIGGAFLVESQASTIVPLLDLAGGGGTFGTNLPYPNGATGQGMFDFAVKATATVTVPAGDWEIAVGSDDGANVVFSSGVTFNGKWGENGTSAANEIRFEAPRGHAWTGGDFTVGGAGVTTTLTAVMYERGGGDTFEVAIRDASGGALGSIGGGAADGWQILGDGVLGWEVSTNAKGQFPVAGVTVGTQPLNGTASFTFGNPPLANPVPGLTHRWFNGYSGAYSNVQDKIVANNPLLPAFQPQDVFSQWWYGSDGTQPLNTVQYPFEVQDIGGINVEANNSYSNYTAVLSGEILIPEDGVIKFKDGVDDYTSLRIDINNNDTFEDNEHLINDSGWTDMLGSANGGSPIVQATFDVDDTNGSWLDIEFVVSEGGGGDAGLLAWDYDPNGGGIGGGVANGFPTVSTQAFGAEAGIAGTDAIDAVMVPDTHLRTRGVAPITGGVIKAKLGTTQEYLFQVAAAGANDKLTVANTNPGLLTTELDVTGAALVVTGFGALANGQTVDIVDADAIVGTPTFTFPAGTTWDTADFATTGEITCTAGCAAGGGGNPFDGDGDGDVDSADLLEFLGAWTGAQAGSKEDRPGIGDLVYDPRTGNVMLVPGPSGKIIGFVLGNAAGLLKPQSADAFLAATPWTEAPIGWDNKPTQIGSSDLAFAGTDGSIDLGAIFPEGMNLDELAEFLSLANYAAGLGSTNSHQLDLIVVPEPSALALIGLGLLGLVNVARRRRSS